MEEALSQTERRLVSKNDVLLFMKVTGIFPHAAFCHRSSGY